MGRLPAGASVQAGLGDRADVEKALRAVLARELGDAKYGLWFGDGVRLALSGDGATLEVRVPSVFFRDWIQGHFAASLREAARLVTGRLVDLSFAVQDEADPAIGDVVGPEPLPAPRRPGSTVVVPLPGHPQSPLFAPPSPAGPAAPPPAPRFPPLPGGSAQERGTAGEHGRRPTAVRAGRRLEDFVVGSCNRLAHAAVREMIHTAGTAFNPLFIHGGVGLGKTHLLEAVVQGLRAAHPGRNVLMVTAESFTNGFLEAMRGGSLASFRSRHRKLGGLAMDDVHVLAGTRATQGEFLHTFNALIDQGAPVILTADQHPRRISRLSDELVTRFLGGMVVKLEAPDQATRRAILQGKSEARGVPVPAAVLDYIAAHLRSSVRELEGALHSVIAHALLTGKRLDLALARTALRDTIRHTAQAVGLRDVEQAVCQLFQIDPEALKSNSRARALTYPRMLAVYLARKHTGAAYSEIGRHFGGRNHSTVISAEKKVRAWLAAEERNALLPGFETVADVLADLERTLGA
jgi:chromosomal replication initiator protein